MERTSYAPRSAALRTMAAVLLVAGVLVACTSREDEVPDAAPQPPRIAVDEAAVERLMSRAEKQQSSALLVSVDGRTVAESGGDDPVSAMSASKSVASLAVGFLVDDGLLSLDAPVANWVPEWRGTPHEQIRVRHLLNHTSGLDPKRADLREGDIAAHGTASGLLFAPGARFQYNNNAVDFLAVVLGRVAGKPLDVLLEERLFEPLGIEDASWVKDRQGVPFAAGELAIRPRDLLAIGQLLVDEGVWRGQRLLSSTWIAESIVASQEHVPAYGLLWWREGEFQLALTAGLLDQWQANAIPPGILSAVRPLQGSTFEAYDGVRDALTEKLGEDGFNEWQVWLRSTGGVPWAVQVQVGASRGFSARGWLGQFLVVIPETRTVAVRMRGITRDDMGGGPEQNAYPGFADDVFACAVRAR